MYSLEVALGQLDWKIDEELMPEVFSIFNELELNGRIEFQTSGSTGFPKKISFSKIQIEASSARTAAFFKLNSGARVFSALPAIYVAGKMMMLRSMLQNWQLHWQKPSATPVITQNYDFGVFTVAQVVSMLEANEHSLDQVKTLLLGGEALTPYAEKLIQKAKLQAFIGYGMTETLTHIALMKIGQEQYYELLPKVEIQLDERGCLKIRDLALQTDWLQTNDVAELIEGRFQILGRSDFVINSGGVKLFSEKIEGRLATLISSSYYVIGREDEKFGQHVTVVIEGEMNEPLQSQLLNLDWGLERPREVVFVTKIERTQSGKIIRK